MAKRTGYLIQGRLGLKIGFEEFELKPGDSISFDPQIPHRQWTIGKKRAEAIWVVSNRHSDNRKHACKRRSARHVTPVG